ncbi:unnamed protein product [Vicia faba]|uniref:Uncharacterized protein n=1 Tax=Vicia faba TaxID=3906 RepID=A0AAV0ZSN5_VICFA|nr:unnamed protein product [Vicia faba]
MPASVCLRQSTETLLRSLLSNLSVNASDSVYHLRFEPSSTPPSLCQSSTIFLSSPIQIDDEPFRNASTRPQNLSISAHLAQFVHLDLASSSVVLIQIPMTSLCQHCIVNNISGFINKLHSSTVSSFNVSLLTKLRCTVPLLFECVRDLVALLNVSISGFVHGMIHGFLLHGAYHEVDEYVKPHWSAEA